MAEIQTQEHGTEAWWTETAAEEWADAIVAAMKLGGIEHLFFVSGSELTFYQEAIAKAHARGRPAPRLVTMTHEHVALNAALGSAMVRNQPAATAVHVDVGTLHYGAAIHTAWRGGYPVLMTAGTGPRAFPGSMRGARGSSVQWVQEPRDQGEIVRQYTKIRPPSRTSGQPGADDQPAAAGRHERAQRPGLPEHSARDRDAPHAGYDALSYPRPAWPGPAGLA